LKREWQQANDSWSDASGGPKSGRGIASVIVAICSEKQTFYEEVAWQNRSVTKIKSTIAGQYSEAKLLHNIEEHRCKQVMPRTPRMLPSNADAERSSREEKSLRIATATLIDDILVGSFEHNCGMCTK
jgi:hypothetical protein